MYFDTINYVLILTGDLNMHLSWYAFWNGNWDNVHCDG